jgi:hypothetical protein
LICIVDNSTHVQRLDIPPAQRETDEKPTRLGNDTNLNTAAAVVVVVVVVAAPELLPALVLLMAEEGVIALGVAVREAVRRL